MTRSGFFRTTIGSIAAVLIGSKVKSEPNTHTLEVKNLPRHSFPEYNTSQEELRKAFIASSVTGMGETSERMLSAMKNSFHNGI